MMRKLTVFVSETIIAAIVFMSTGATTIEGATTIDAQADYSADAGEKVILRLLSQSTAAAVDEYYGEHRQYWRQEVLSVQKVEESPYCEVVIRVETFCGAHNPPYGHDTMIFRIDPAGEVQLVSFDHQNEE